jgi:uncharacterized protein (TIGR03085 family)
VNLARRERHALCDLALELGPDAPTLCDGWTARDLVAHLLVRERSPLAGVGIAVPQLAGLTERAMSRTAAAPFEQSVERLRSVGLTPFRLPGVEWLANTVEYVVHHEDLRRGQADWSPRELPRADEDTLWTQLRVLGLMVARKAGVPLVVRRSDVAAQSLTLLGGERPAEVIGRPSELVLMLSGRTELADLEWLGDRANLQRLREADLSA